MLHTHTLTTTINLECSLDVQMSHDIFPLGWPTAIVQYGCEAAVALQWISGNPVFFKRRLCIKH